MSRPGFFFLICPDSELIQIKVRELVQTHPPQEGGEYERCVFWGDEGLDDRFWEGLTLQSLLGRPKLILVRMAQNLLTDDWARLSSPLSRFNAQAWPIFCLEAAFNRGKPSIPKGLAKKKFWLFAQKKGWEWRSPGLDFKTMKQMVRDWAKSKGIGFAPGGLEALCPNLPLNAAGLATELDKIELSLGPDRRIGPEAAGLANHSQDMDVFAMLRAMQSGSAQAAVWRKILSARLSGESMLFSFLGLLAREARIMWQLCLNDKLSVNLPPRVRSEKQSLAGKLGPGGLARIFDLALQAELGVKSGQRGVDQAMDFLVAGLADIFSPQARPGRVGNLGPGR